jgi:hypothetical protein
VCRRLLEGQKCACPFFGLIASALQPSAQFCVLRLRKIHPTPSVPSFCSVPLPETVAHTFSSRYHDNWLQNLLVSASLGGYRHCSPQIP